MSTTGSKKRNQDEQLGDSDKASGGNMKATEAMHLGWSDKQRRILTADGKGAEFYTADRGFAFEESELPHYWLSQGTTENLWKTFHEWKNESDSSSPPQTKSKIVGAWKRPLFYGGWEYSTEETENVYNVQTHTLFVDLRLPVMRLTAKDRPFVQSLDDLSGHELRLYARQHCFAGYSFLESAQTVSCAANTSGFDQVCARHHCIDWNFVGTPRNRPNKWWIQVQTQQPSCIDNNDDNNDSDSNSQSAKSPIHTWKEWAFSTDDSGQHYYCEQWERLPTKISSQATISNAVFALYRKTGGVIVVAHDHFNYCFDRPFADLERSSKGSLVEVVDDFVEQNNLAEARRWLSLKGGHGTVSSGWVVDSAVEFWVEGKPLWSLESVQLKCSNSSDARWWESCSLHWNEEVWFVFECNLDSFQELDQYFTDSLQRVSALL
mmetsp:Transcript_3364/g.4477  ORF Transcript_3364/g.4477 Transcript_3364/m.4477 type:complete len:435 (-) Transcript_3364:179-1483(-)